MGYDATCTLRIDGASSRGTAWLEHKDLVFRGPTRLAIPLDTITEATARDGVLRVRFGGRLAEFEIGAAAARWADRISNPPSRLDKLGVKPGMRIGLIGVDDATLAAEVRDRGATLVQMTAAGPPLDMLFYQADTRKALERLATLIRRMTPAGAIWLLRPKGRPEIISEADSMAAGRRVGLVDVKVVSFSEVYSAEKYVVPVASRPRPPSPRAPRKTTPRTGGRRD